MRRTVLLSLLVAVLGCGAEASPDAATTADAALARDAAAAPDDAAAPDAAEVTDSTSARDTAAAPDGAGDTVAARDVTAVSDTGNPPDAASPTDGVSDREEGSGLDVELDADGAADAGFDAGPEEPPLPPLTTLADGFHVPFEAPGAGAPFSLIVASDPQLWWNFIDGEQGFDDAAVEARNNLHIDAMNALVRGEGLPEGTAAPTAVVMNGDLTEYGRWFQWDAYYRLYARVQAPIFDGLGNHEYQNNNVYVGNGCAMQFVDWVAWQDACRHGSPQMLWGESACEVADHFSEEEHAFCAADAMRRMRCWLRNHDEDLYDWDEGSAAYSWEMGNFHFVQLHNYPDYEVPETRICSAVPWLKRDLHDAFLRGKRIVVHMHQPRVQELSPLLAGYEYNVVGIFYGHHHAHVGYDGDLQVGEVAIPRFYSGSVEWNLFSLARFEEDRLTVIAIDSNTGAPVHHATAAEYDSVGAGARVAAPFTYVFPIHDCPTGRIPAGETGACTPVVPELPPVELCY